MADAITAQWHGHNYQSRFFWLNAMDLLRPDTCINRVTFEDNIPKSFDDVVLYYDPPVVRSGPVPIEVEYYQIKWHVTSGRFGYEDLTLPKFINAKSVSFLQRLRNAKKTVGDVSGRMCFVTTDRVADDDPLRLLISGNDQSLLTEKLFDGTSDRSRMGRIRRCWRDHLELPDDESLREIIEGLVIVDGYKTLLELRDEINFKAELVGLLPNRASDSDFRYDELARQLKVRGISSMNRQELIDICTAEGLWIGERKHVDEMLPVAIRSFQRLSTDMMPAAIEDTLRLTDSFRARYISENQDWQQDIMPRVTKFLVERASRSRHLRLILDAHASIAYLSGVVYHVKSGLEIELVQKGRVGTRIWRPDDGSTGPAMQIVPQHVGSGQEIAVAVSITHQVTEHVNRYVDANLPQVGQIISFEPPEGPGQQGVSGGEHAAHMAERLSNAVRSLKTNTPDATVHIFAACPNSLLFFLGQSHVALAPVIVYEFDFDRKGNKTYQPSFKIDAVDDDAF